MKVFLTGASSGIGEALARHYAGRGATLGLFARRAELLRTLKASLPGAVEIYAGDVRDLGALKSAAADFIAKHGVPDLVIANAGISHGTLTEYAEDAATFREVLDVNVLGLVHTFHPFIEGMRARGTGALAGIASVAGVRGLPGTSAYSASKAAAINYLEALRVEMRRSGITVSAICPGFIATPMSANNPYPMPFIISAADAARRIARAIDARKGYAIIPWQMAIVARILKILPTSVYDRVMANQGRKPRKA